MQSLQTNRSLEVGLFPAWSVSGGSCSPDGHTGTWGSPGIWEAPYNKMFISIEELWVALDMAGKKIKFLTDKGATYCVLASNFLGPSPLKPALLLGSKESQNWNISPPL